MSHALIIDDNVGNAKVLERLLLLQGASATSVHDLSELDGIFDGNSPISVIFLDLEMPQLDGYEVLNKIRNNPNLNGIPVVACTVHTSEIHRARDMGFDSFVAKPINAERFPSQLERILMGEQVWAAV